MVQGYFALENDSLLGLMQKKKKKIACNSVAANCSLFCIWYVTCLVPYKEATVWKWQ